MKKIITLLSIFILTLAALGGTFSEELEKIFTTSAAELIAEPVINEIIDSLTVSQESFHSQYRNVRSIVYHQPMLRGPKDSGIANWHTAMRTLVVTKMKKYLHENNNLQELYKTHRKKFQEKAATLSPESKAKMRTQLAEAQETFATMKAFPVGVSFIAFQKAEKEYTTSVPDLHLLGRNLDEDQVLRVIQNGGLNKREIEEITEEAFLAHFKGKDRHLAKFAGRRFAEGDITLIDQYLKIIELILEDLK